MESSANKQEKPFWDHLEELRDRLMNCLRALLVTSIAAYMVRQPILTFLKAPLFAALPEDKRHLYFTGLFESFLNHLQISMLAGLFIGSPYFAYQIWGFVAPGLHPKERKTVVPFIFAATFFFLLGGAFAYYLVLPYGFKFFIEFGAPNDMPMITVKEYFSTLFRLLLLFGACFELPVVLVLLAKFGIVNAEFLRAHRRNVLIGITVASAFFAPPDVMSMILMMTPLYLFFEAAILVIAVMDKNKKSSQAGV